ncbi:glycosyltransferase 87 family protein [Planotetraspora sp. GP83]|uniref:glycosyltransferase 87 family protein n=1 Tax=Planotetraspora sp. GP83 TaxID=3156264 RepID=UPI003515EAE3
MTGIILAAVAVRACKFDFESTDYTVHLKHWYDYIHGHGGFSAVGDNFSTYNFSDYNAPYLYLLAALTYLPVQAQAGIKLISVIFDLLLAFFAYRMASLRYPDSWQPVMAAAAVLFLPTVIMNGALWGQSDSIYAAFAVGGVYLLMRDRPWMACTFFGLALAFKLQAVFIFPLLLVLALLKRLPWQTLIAVPATYLALDIPALLLGASPENLLTVYLRQTESYQDLTLDAPSIYQWVTSSTHADVLRTAGILFTSAVLIALIALVAVNRAALTNLRIALLAATSAVLVPFLLPSMHERYFYLADVLSVMVAFYLPRRLWYAPIAVQVSSALSYLPFLGMPLFQGDAASLEFKLLAGVMALALAALLGAGFREFRKAGIAQSGIQESFPAGEPAPSAPGSGR